MNWTGPWNGAVIYNPGDGVSDGGSSYICIQASGPSNPQEPPNAFYWGQLASQGASGADGPGLSGLTTGRVPYAANSTTLMDSANLTFDGVNLSISARTAVTVLAASVTYYIAPTGSDSTGDGSSGNPWLTIGKFLTVMGQYVLPNGVIATLYLKDGTYPNLASVSIAHPNGSQIAILGQNTYDKTMSSVTSSGTPGAWTLNLTLSNATNVAVGDYVLIKTATGGTGPLLTVGCHKVTAVAGNVISVLSLSRFATGPSGAVTGTVRVVKSILSFASYGLNCQSGVQIGGFVIVLPPSTGYGIWAASNQPGLCASVECRDLGINGGQYGIYMMKGVFSLTSTSTDYVCISGASSVGVQAYGGASFVYLLTGVVSGCNTGIASTVAGCIEFSQGTLSGNNIGAYASVGGLNRINSAAWYGNTTNASPTVDALGNSNGLNVTAL